MSKPFVAILMGSASDLDVMKVTADTLKDLHVVCEINVLSAHRTPEETRHYVQEAEDRGCAVFIAAAGLAAHLAGFIAAHTLKPVIGVPMSAGSLQGLDALLSTVQMPGGIPVACVAIGSAGAKNAAFLAAQILALSNPTLGNTLTQERQKQRALIVKKNQDIQQQLPRS